MRSKLARAGDVKCKSKLPSAMRLVTLSLHLP